MGQAALKNCPICGKPSVERYRPFCCARCADIDLGRWFTGRYAVPTDEKPGEQTPESVEPDLNIH